MRRYAVLALLTACRSPSDKAVDELSAIATTVCTCTTQQCVDDSGLSAAIARVKADQAKFSPAQMSQLLADIERGLACSNTVNEGAAWKRLGQDRPAGSTDSRWFKLHVPACDELVALLDKTEGCAAVDRHAVAAASDAYMRAATELRGGSDRAKMEAVCRAGVAAATQPFAVCDAKATP